MVQETQLVKFSIVGLPRKQQDTSKSDSGMVSFKAADGQPEVTSEPKTAAKDSKNTRNSSSKVSVIPRKLDSDEMAASLAENKLSFKAKGIDTQVGQSEGKNEETNARNIEKKRRNGDAQGKTGEAKARRSGLNEKSADSGAWEQHTVQLSRIASYGFGIAVSGGRDNPHFTNGDTSIAISDVLKSGPAEGKLLINDRILSANGVSLENVDHATAISVLKDSGNSVNLVIRRKKTVPPGGEAEHSLRITLTRKNKKEELGLVLGYQLYIKEITANSLAALDGSIREGDTIIKINNTPAESLSLIEARKQLEKAREKLQLTVSTSRTQGVPEPNNNTHDVLPSKQDDDPDYPRDYVRTSELRVEPIEVPNKKSTLERNPSQSNPAHMRPFSFADLDRPVTPVGGYSNQQNSVYDVPRQTQLDREWRPLEPAYGRHGNREPDHGYHLQQDEVDAAVRRRHAPDASEARLISFKKDRGSGVGIRISGGNRTGIFVAKVGPNTPAAEQGLHEGDVILKVNEVDLNRKTREEAVLLLLSLREQVTLLVHYRLQEYEELMAQGGTGDSFFIRTHFTYDEVEHGEMRFANGTVFHVTDTLYGGVVGSWQASRIGRHNQDTGQRGIIPNQNRAEQLYLSQQEEKSETGGGTLRSQRGPGGSFFKKKARRAKSLGKDHWDDVIFGMDRRPTHTNPVSKFPAYERVLLQDVTFMRPVVIFGPLSDVARDKLVREVPDWFESPQTEEGRRGEEAKNRSGIIKLGAIRQIMDRRKHAVLDVTPNAVDRLNYSQFVPIVVYLRCDNKNDVKDLRQRWAKNSSKSARKLYEQAVKLEKHYPHLFTTTIAVSSSDSWYRKLQEAVRHSQQQKVWKSEKQPEDPMKDDLLFPMSQRLSYASSPESDVESSHPHSFYDGGSSAGGPRNRLMRSSSDPSLNTQENVPGIPPYPQPPNYNRAPSADRRVNPLPKPRHYGHDQSDGAWESRSRPEDRYYASYYGDSQPRDGGPIQTSPRSRIDLYATLTPAERMRTHQQPEALQYEDPYRDPRSASNVPPTGGRGTISREPSLRYTGEAPYSQSPSEGYTYRSGGPQLALPKPQNVEKLSYGPSFSGDHYSKFASNPANRHDDSKLHEKFAIDVPPQSQSPYDYPPQSDRDRSSPQRPRPPERVSSKNDPYRFTRMTANPTYKTATIDKARLSDLSAKYRHDDNTRPGPQPPLRSHQAPSYGPPASRGHVNNDQVPAKSKTNVYDDARVPALNEANQATRSQTNLVSPPTNTYEDIYEERDAQDSADKVNKVESNISPKSDLKEKEPAKDGQHTVVATARGVFDSNGGVLESKETGVSIVIPKGAIKEGVQQEIYFKVCQDNSILPPLDKEKGETLLSPLVMCGPHGLKFLQPVELRLPHCASVNPDSWSFALKSSDTPAGSQPSQWQNMTLAGLDGVSQGRVGKNSVSVLVDHF